ncbi:MAG: GNAT family N-acetyltransferase [Burkholderiales bacterium]
MLTRRISGLAGLHTLREPWLSLHASADLYARYEWHLACAMHLLGDATSLAYVQVLDGARTVAIVPAIVSKASVSCFGQLRVLSLGLHAHLSLADFPLATDVPVKDIATALRTALATWPEPWDAVHWPRTLGSSHAMRLARALGAPAAHVAAVAPCNTLDTQRPFPQLLAGLSKNLRASLRKAQKRLEQSGGVYITVNGVPIYPASGSSEAALGGDRVDAIDAAYEAFLALEGSGWKGKAGMGSAVRLNPATRGFYAELLAQRSADFVPEVTLLVRGDTPIAAQFSVNVNGCKHVLKIGYDEAESRFSPGQVLMARVLEVASGKAFKRVSLVTDMQWHQTWRPLPEPAFSVVVFRKRWRAALHSTYLAARRTGKLALLAYRRLRERPGAGDVASAPAAATQASIPMEGSPDA